MWESLLFALIGKLKVRVIILLGEQFEEPLVIGASISIRTYEYHV